LAWPRPAPGPEQASHPARPVVREQVSRGGARSPDLLALQRPAPLRQAKTAEPAGLAPGPAGSGPATSRTTDPAGPAGAWDAAAVPPPRPADRRADQGRRESEQARQAPPQIDINRVIGTVQRRLMHQLAIERERRGLTR
jgi:hypothetical protein